MALGSRKKATSKPTKAKEYSSKQTNRGARLLMHKSCAGCKYHDMKLVPGTGAQSLFNHYCKLKDAWALFSLPSEVPKNRSLPVITYTGTPRIAPPQPAWCREDRPQWEG